ncbi:hypothetical protein LSH36_285g02033 [Paralvinella palmiformis]|uniref:DNA mismatch repair proteins mutS family domain-containing protein n=1 Tax=Paralvinella palmiformis TaxID=53620 RepID=A0AAD9N209_9ANNE|nr:hypothetical protein LSH36_285g02033 [Paralvinella palmiformis]
MPDAVEMEKFTILSKVLLQTRPSCVVMSAKEDERLVKAVKDTVEKEAGTDMDAQYIQILPSTDYSIEMSKRRILNMSLPNIPADFDETERMLHLSSLVPFSNMCLVRALGGLLRFIEKNRVGIELEDATMRIPVLSVKTFSLEDLVLIDEQTYRLWFLQPLKNIEKLKERHEAVSFFADQRYMEITLSLQKCLHQIKDTKHTDDMSTKSTEFNWSSGRTGFELHALGSSHIQVIVQDPGKILARMRMAQASVGDWQSLYKTVYGAVYIADVCRSQSTNLPLLQNIKLLFTDDLHKIANLISKIVDFDESAVQNRFVVKPNVDLELDEKKRMYGGLPDFMTAVAREELAQLGDDISHCNVLYLPQLGYLLSVPVTDAMKESKNYEIPGLEFVFISNNVVHYKSPRTIDYETGIMHRLQNVILEHSAVLIDVAQFAAKLDCILALAACAREYNYVKPEIISEDIIQINRGSGGKFSRMKILTGPNASGKSVYLKQVALIVYMAQIGSFVPAEKAIIGLVDGIYTRISTTESVSVGLSAFMIDLNQTLDVLQHEKELVFLYELKDGHTDTSYACHIASQAGLPEEIVKRGAEVSKLVKENQPVHRVDTASTATQYKRCEAIVDRFLDFDLDNDDVQSFLQNFVIPVYQGTIKP